MSAETKTKEQRLAQLQQLTQTFGPSGSEEDIRALLKKLAVPYADSLTVDSLGNLIAFKQGTGAGQRKKLLFSAHMDSVGVLVTHITKEGYVKFSPLGGLVAADLSRQTVVFQSGLRGVISVPEDKEEKTFRLDDLYLDIGANSKEEAEKLVHLGDPAVFAPTFYVQGERVFANYLDNRAGCLALLEVLEQAKSVHDLYFLFSVQEEVGLRGGKTGAYGVNPHYGIAVDVTCTDDLPGATHTSTAKLGGGAAIKLLDHSVLCTPQVYEHLDALAKENNIPAQRDIMAFGGTDAGAIAVTRGGVKTGGVSVPCRYTHAPVECMDWKDYEASVTLLTTLAESELP